MLPRESYFDSKEVEPGPNPIVTDKGILLVYNGWGEDNIYKPGGVVFPKEKSAEVVIRTKEPLLNLSREYGRKYGTLNHCVAEGLIRDKDQWLLYYGAADRLVCMAVCKGGE